LKLLNISQFATFQDSTAVYLSSFVLWDVNVTQVDNSLQTFRYNIASRVKQCENNSFWTAGLNSEISKLIDSTESKFVWKLSFIQKATMSAILS